MPNGKKPDLGVVVPTAATFQSAYMALVKAVQAMDRANEIGTNDDAKWRRRWQVLEAAIKLTQVALPPAPPQAERLTLESIEAYTNRINSENAELRAERYRARMLHPEKG